jgi:beta-lactamase regulating signal transducer with metallopeptidase domain
MVRRERDEVFKLFTALLPAYSHYDDLRGLTASSTHIASYGIRVSLFQLPWASWIFVVYIAGTLISFIRVVIGRLGLVFLKRNAVPLHNENYSSVVRKLSYQVGIRSKVSLYKSPLCRIPFTFSLRRPNIIFPANVESWSMKRIRHVLIHELTHVQRRDYLILFVSRILCALFWFMPMVWIAYSKLQIEQESACDLFVIEQGVRPTTYARQLVEIARFTRGHAIITCIFISKGGKKMLEKRIRNVLSCNRRVFQATIKRSLVAIIICSFCLLPFLIFNPVIAQEKNADEVLYGTWVNPEYNKTVVAKFIMQPDDVMLSYIRETDAKHSVGRRFHIVESWEDTNGDVWYKFTLEHTSWEFILARISDSGRIYEQMAAPTEFATEIDAESRHYRIYYRQ